MTVVVAALALVLLPSGRYEGAPSAPAPPRHTSPARTTTPFRPPAAPRPPSPARTTTMFEPPVVAGGGPSSAPSVDQRLARLRRGAVAFTTPERLKLHESAEIQLLVSLDASTRKLKQQLSEAGARVAAPVGLSDRVEARLSGLGFDIQAVTPEVQRVSGFDTTEWRWQIEPVSSGVRRLHLTLTALLGTGEEAHTVRVFDRTLTVRVSWGQRMSSFLGGNWQWLWTSILVPLATVVLVRARRRRTRAEEPPGTAPTTAP